MQNGSKKIAFFGTPPFTVSFLDALKDTGFMPSLVVTNPDRPAGRGLELLSPEPKRWAERNNVEALQPERLDHEFITTLKSSTWDLFVVVAYGKIIPEEIINLPEFGTINVHYSLLPKYRGATPVESAILNGDSVTVVVIQQMRYKLDTGPVLAQKEVDIYASDTTETLRERLNAEALSMLPETIGKIFHRSVAYDQQDEEQASHCRKITKEDGEISLSDDPTTLDRKFRAYTPWPGLFFFTMRGGRNIRVKIKDAHFIDGRFVIDTVVPESGKPMTWEQFQNWHTF